MRNALIAAAVALGFAAALPAPGRAASPLRPLAGVDAASGIHQVQAPHWRRGYYGRPHRRYAPPAYGRRYAPPPRYGYRHGYSGRYYGGYDVWKRTDPF